MEFTLKTPVSFLKGVGKKRYDALKKSGIETLSDLAFLFPSSYRSGKVFQVAPERVGLFSYFHLTVDTAPFIANIKGRGPVLRYVASDEEGNRVQVLHFHQPYLKNKILKGESLYFGGILQERKGVYYLFSPSMDKKMPDQTALLPIYPKTAGLSSGQIKELISQFLISLLPQIKETLPEKVLRFMDLCPLSRAIYYLHNPIDEEKVEEAKKRLAFEELFRFSVKSTLFSRENEKITVSPYENSDLTPFLSQLPFSMTGAQKRVVEEIRSDLCGDVPVNPMDRLLQGDVGSGKTAVAAAAAYLAAINSKSTLVMAPTEILAAQHYRAFSAFLSPFPYKVYLITGSTGKKERERIYGEIEGGAPYILIGTHALIEEKTRISGVGLAITDEQHRFGVRHRTRLSAKGGAVHSLVMSATPIPRSLAMFLHARSRISVIDELPPGRKEISTFYIGEDKIERLMRFLDEKIKEGGQAYIVCPLIEDSEDVNPLISATEELEEIRKALPHIESALLHGKMKPEEKRLVMEDFKQGKTKILVSTTVIEVGVDVPKATVMVVRCAERFGLSQLHQLRGRVGRGSDQSYCILVSSHSGKSARERLKKMCDCHDGFELARFDLETRGPGEFFGTRQSGFGSSSLIGSFSMEMIQKAGEAARMFLEEASPEEIAVYQENFRLN